MGVWSMREVANGHAGSEAGRLAASLAQARRRCERAERDRRLEKLAVEVITTRTSDLVSPKHIDAKEVAKLERKSEPPMFTSPDRGGSFRITFASSGNSVFPAGGGCETCSSATKEKRSAPTGTPRICTGPELGRPALSPDLGDAASPRRPQR
jgi:hypothetical protein